jgi:hypothetical protein
MSGLCLPKQRQMTNAQQTGNGKRKTESIKSAQNTGYHNADEKKPRHEYPA